MVAVSQSKLAGSPNTYIAALQKDVIGLLTAKGEMEGEIEGLRGAMEELKVDMGMEFEKVRFEVEYGSCMCGKFTPPPWMVVGDVGAGEWVMGEGPERVGEALGGWEVDQREAGGGDGRGMEGVQGTEDETEAARDCGGYETENLILCGKRE